MRPVRQRFLEVIQILLQIVANDARLNDSHIKPIIQKIIGSVDGYK